MISLLRIVFGILLGLILVVGLIVWAGRWFLYYDADLPNVQELGLFAPQAATVIPQAYVCRENAQVIAIPTRQLTNVRNALFAAEGEVDPRNISQRLYEDAVGGASTNPRYGAYSQQIAGQLFCDDRRGLLRHEVSEMRTTAQIERHFTTDQILDIYLNRAFFGTGLYGIENASERYFAKSAAQLTTPEAALVLGMIRSPNEFAPDTHPLGAFGRRNQVIEAMEKQGTISSQEAQEAKAAPLGTAAENAAAH